MKKQLFLTMALLMLFFGSLFSQGVTTSSLTGKVTDDKGQGVLLATVLAVHTPSGTQYGTFTSEDGLFSIQNMKVGGPYTVTVTFVGYENAVVGDIDLQLNNTSFVDIVLKSTSIELAEVVIKGGKEARRDQTGAMTNLVSKQITSLPTIMRSQQDLTGYNFRLLT